MYVILDKFLWSQSMKNHLCAIMLSGCLLTGCSWITDAASPSPLYEVPESKKVKIYNATMKKLAISTHNDPKYQRIELDTAKNKMWFQTLSYKLWNREITKAQFIEEGLKKYPKHRYEFEFIAEGLNLQNFL